MLLFTGLVIASVDLGYLYSILTFTHSYHLDKVGHLLLYGFTAWVLNHTLDRRWTVAGKWPIVQGSAILGIVMTFEEISQYFIPYRHFEWADLLANYIGIFVLAVFVPPLPEWKFRLIGLRRDAV